MPEDTTITAPVTANTPAPEGDGIPSGIEEAMKAFQTQTTPKPKTEDAPPADPKGKVEPPKPDPKGAATPPKPEPKPEDLWEKAPPKLKGEYFKMQRTLQDRLEAAEKKVKEIESKRVETPADTKQLEALNKQIAELEQRLSATDYRQSSDFQKNFVAKWQNEYKAAVEEVKQLVVKQVDTEGNEKTRPATEQDFQYLMRLAPRDRGRTAHEMFGPDGPMILARMMRLQQIERESEDAVNERAANSKKDREEREAAERRSADEYKGHYDASVAELQKSWPQYFAEDEKDPEVTEALRSGYKFVDQVQTASNLPADQRAALSAVIRARAAGFGSLMLRYNRLEAQNKALEAELGKFRKTDPGATGGAGGGGGGSNGEEGVPGSIEEAAKQFMQKK